MAKTGQRQVASPSDFERGATSRQPPGGFGWRHCQTVVRVLVILSVILVNAACFIAIKAGLNDTPPLLFASLRLLVGSIALFRLLLAGRWPLLPSRQSWPGLLVLALSASAVAYGAMFLSPAFTGAGVATLLGNTQPLMTVALAAVFLGERMTRSKWLALLLGLAGVSLIAFPALTRIGELAGALLALISAGGLAVGSVVVKRIASKTNLLTLTTWQLLLGSLPLLAVSVMLEREQAPSWTLGFTGLLLLLAIVGTAFVTVAWYWLVQGDEVGRLSMFFFLVPVFGLGLAAWLLGERVTPIQVAGFVLVLSGIVPVSGNVWRGEGRARSANPSP